MSYKFTDFLIVGPQKQVAQEDPDMFDAFVDVGNEDEEEKRKKQMSAHFFFETAAGADAGNNYAKKQMKFVLSTSADNFREAAKAKVEECVADTNLEKELRQKVQSNDIYSSLPASEDNSYLNAALVIDGVERDNPDKNLSTPLNNLSLTIMRLMEASLVDTSKKNPVEQNEIKPEDKCDPELQAYVEAVKTVQKAPVTVFNIEEVSTVLGGDENFGSSERKKAPKLDAVLEQVMSTKPLPEIQPQLQPNEKAPTEEGENKDQEEIIVASVTKFDGEKVDDHRLGEGEEEKKANKILHFSDAQGLNNALGNLKQTGYQNPLEDQNLLLLKKADGSAMGCSVVGREKSDDRTHNDNKPEKHKVQVTFVVPKNTKDPKDQNFINVWYVHVNGTGVEDEDGKEIPNLKIKVKYLFSEGRVRIHKTAYYMDDAGEFHRMDKAKCIELAGQGMNVTKALELVKSMEVSAVLHKVSNRTKEKLGPKVNVAEEEQEPTPQNVFPELTNDLNHRDSFANLTISSPISSVLKPVSSTTAPPQPATLSEDLTDNSFSPQSQFLPLEPLEPLKLDDSKDPFTDISEQAQTPKAGSLSPLFSGGEFEHEGDEVKGRNEVSEGDEGEETDTSVSGRGDKNQGKNLDNYPEFTPPPIDQNLSKESEQNPQQTTEERASTDSSENSGDRPRSEEKAGENDPLTINLNPEDVGNSEEEDKINKNDNPLLSTLENNSDQAVSPTKEGVSSLKLTIGAEGSERTPEDNSDEVLPSPEVENKADTVNKDQDGSQSEEVEPEETFNDRFNTVFKFSEDTPTTPPTSPSLKPFIPAQSNFLNDIFDQGAFGSPKLEDPALTTPAAGKSPPPSSDADNDLENQIYDTPRVEDNNLLQQKREENRKIIKASRGEIADIQQDSSDSSDDETEEQKNVFYNESDSESDKEDQSEESEYDEGDESENEGENEGETVMHAPKTSEQQKQVAEKLTVFHGLIDQSETNNKDDVEKKDPVEGSAKAELYEKIKEAAKEILNNSNSTPEQRNEVKVALLARLVDSAPPEDQLHNYLLFVAFLDLDCIGQRARNAEESINPEEVEIFSANFLTEADKYALVTKNAVEAGAYSPKVQKDFELIEGMVNGVLKNQMIATLRGYNPRVYNTLTENINYIDSQSKVGASSYVSQPSQGEEQAVVENLQNVKSVKTLAGELGNIGKQLDDLRSNNDEDKKSSQETNAPSIADLEKQVVNTASEIYNHPQSTKEERRAAKEILLAQLVDVKDPKDRLEAYVSLVSVKILLRMLQRAGGDGKKISPQEVEDFAKEFLVEANSYVAVTKPAVEQGGYSYTIMSNFQWIEVMMNSQLSKLSISLENIDSTSYNALRSDIAAIDARSEEILQTPRTQVYPRSQSTMSPVKRGSASGGSVELKSGKGSSPEKTTAAVVKPKVVASPRTPSSRSLSSARPGVRERARARNGKSSDPKVVDSNVVTPSTPRSSQTRVSISAKHVKAPSSVSPSSRSTGSFSDEDLGNLSPANELGKRDRIIGDRKVASPPLSPKPKPVVAAASSPPQTPLRTPVKIRGSASTAAPTSTPTPTSKSTVRISRAFGSSPATPATARRSSLSNSVPVEESKSPPQVVVDNESKAVFDDYQPKVRVNVADEKRTLKEMAEQLLYIGILAGGKKESLNAELNSKISDFVKKNKNISNFNKVLAGSSIGAAGSTVNESSKIVGLIKSGHTIIKNQYNENGTRKQPKTSPTSSRASSVAPRERGSRGGGDDSE